MTKKYCDRCGLFITGIRGISVDGAVYDKFYTDLCASCEHGMMELLSKFLQKTIKKRGWFI